MTEMTEKIPSNDEIIAMIPSKTMREYLTKIRTLKKLLLWLMYRVEG